MRWTNCKLMILLCYFVAFNCFCLGAFLPQVLAWSRVNSGYMVESKDLKVAVKPTIAQVEKPKPKKNKPSSAVCEKYGVLE